MSAQAAPDAAPRPALLVQDREEVWHPFDRHCFDGSQLYYPAFHVRFMPLGSRAADLHARMSKAVRTAYADLVTAHPTYWETGVREAWEERELMSEVLPGYLHTLDQAERGLASPSASEPSDVAFECFGLRFGDYEVVDVRDILDLAIAVAEFFTPELTERNDNKSRRDYFFKRAPQRRALVACRDAHLATLRALLAEVGGVASE